MPAGQSEQAVGFLLEFRNEAVDELRETKAAFDEAVDALERAVDAAQAAFTFLEEGTGRLATSIGTAVDSAVRKTDDLRTAVKTVGEVEVQPPNLDPIQQAMDSLGADIQAPIDSGISEVSDAIDEINEKEVQGPSIEEWVAFQDAAGDSVEAVDDVTEALTKGDSRAGDYVRTLSDLSVTASETRRAMRKNFEGLDSALAVTGDILVNELIPSMEEFGQRGKDAAANIGGDAVDAYARLQRSAEQFFQENARAFSEANDVAAIWDGFLEAEDTDIRKVQDLLRVADKTTLEPLVENLVEQLGDAALAEQFWQPIAANKNVDKEFFKELRDQFKKERKTYENWWDRMSDTAQDFFWPVFVKQGEKAAEGITDVLAEKLKSAFQSPVAQFTAAIQLSKLIDKIFGPALDLLGEIIGQALLPAIRMMVDFLEEMRPAIISLSQAFVPLFEALGKVLREVAHGLLPVFEAFGLLVEALSPAITMIANILGGVLAITLGSTGEILSFVGGALKWVSDLLYDLLGGILMLIKPIIEWVKWLDETFMITKALGVVITAFLIPAVVGWAASAIPTAIMAMSAWIASASSVLYVTWDNITANWTLGASYLSGILPGLGAAVTAMWGWVSSLWASVASMLTGVIPALWGAVVATWSFTAALLANPITWIVLAVAAGIGLLVGLVWLLWEPIEQVFGYLGDVFEPLLGWIQTATDFFGDWGSMIASVVMGPINMLIGALSWIVDLFSWIFGAGEESENTFSLGWIMDGIMWFSDWVFGWLDWIPDWVKFLLGIEDAEVPEGGPDEQAGIEDAKAMVEGAEEGAEEEASSKPDWWKSMFGIDEEATDEVSAEASESFEGVGQEAGGSLLGEGEGGFLGLMDSVGAMAGFFMLEGMSEGMFSLASMFPLSDIFGTMFGPFANIMAQPDSGAGVKTPNLSGVTVGQVDYEMETEFSADEMSDPVVRAIVSQTYRLEQAIANSGDAGLDLDLQDLKDIAEW